MVPDIYEAVVEATNQRAHFFCSHIDNQTYISEMRICYNKALRRVDCEKMDTVKSEEDNDIKFCQK